MDEQERQRRIQRSNTIAELLCEYKEIQSKISHSMLPVKPDAYQERLREIIDECWTYSFDIKKDMRG